MPVLNVLGKVCRNEAERPSNGARLYIAYADSEGEPFLAEKYSVSVCCGLAEILHRGGLVDRAELPSAGRMEKLS